MDETLGERVRRHRRALNLTQKQLGELSGLERVSISGIERGAQEPSRTKVRALARVLKVSPRYLEYGPDLPIDPVAANIPTPVYSDLSGNLSPADLAHIEKVIAREMTAQMERLLRMLRSGEDESRRSDPGEHRGRSD